MKALLVVVGRKGSAGSINYYIAHGTPIGATFYIRIIDNNIINLKFLYFQLQKLQLNKISSQSAVPGLNRNQAYNKKIPLSPLEVQKEIVAEIDGYQKIIDGAKQIVENWKPDFKINPK